MGSQIEFNVSISATWNLVTCRFSLLIFTAANFCAVVRYVLSIECDLTGRTPCATTKAPKAPFLFPPKS